MCGSDVTSPGAEGGAESRLARPGGWRLKAYFAILVALFALAAAAACAYAFVQADRDARDAAEHDARFAAGTVAKQVGDGVALLRATVEQLAATPNIEQAFETPNDCSLTFGGVEGLASGHIDVVRSNGRVGCSSRQPQGGEPLSGYRGDGWLERASAGPLFEAPVEDSATGRHAIISAAPIEGGVVAAFLDLEPAAAGLVRLYGGGRPVVFTITDGKTVLARSIEPERWIGKSIEGTDFQAGLGRSERPDLAGTPRIFADARIPGTGWTIHVGEDKEAALADANRLRNRQLAIILAGFALVLLATVLIYRRVALPVKHLGSAVRATAKLSPPAPVPASGPAEVRALGEDVNGLIAAVGERERLEEQLRQAQRMEAIGRLAGGIAHDFNNLLTAVIGYSDLLLARSKPGDPGRTETEEIKTAGERAVALTRQLLALGRGQALEPVVLDLNEVVRGLEPMLRRLMRADVEVRTSLAGEQALVQADRGQLEQVLVNLVVNASEAMPHGGRVTIATSAATLDEDYFRLHPAGKGEPGRYVMLEVADTGVGMDDETVSHIFEPFFTTKGSEGGTGLGLATVYGIVRQNGGFVWAYSEVGRGTSFKTYLPMVAGEVEEQPLRGPRTRLAAGGRTVLLVEDDAPVRAVVRHMLDAHGFRILEAREGDEALSLSNGEEPGAIDVLVADTVIPGPGGVELSRRVRERHPELRTLIMSGYSERDATRDIPLPPGSEFIAKPFSSADFDAKLASLLGEATSSAR